MIWDSIPQTLKDNGLWCCWKLTDKGKVPIDAITGKMARSNDKTTFHPFIDVLKRLANYYNFDEHGKLLGGLGLGIFNGFSAIDIDNCRDAVTGKMTPMAEDIIDYCQSYTEISPSGKGIRIIFRTDTVIDKNMYYINNRNNGLEIYISDNTNKFVTITGNVLYPSDVRYVDMTYVLNKYMSRENKLDIALTKDKKLYELYNAQAPGSGANESEMDLALCSKLAYYLDNNESMVNSAFISSPYFLSKDVEHKQKWLVRDDYRLQTIKMALKPVPVVSDNYDLNDTGNAHRFVARFGDIIRYNVDNQKWMIWNGKYWQMDVYNNIKNYAELVIEEMKQQVLSMAETNEKKALMNNIKRALSSSGKIAFLKEAEHISGIPVTNNNFDRDPFMLNCASGVIDLHDGTIRPHDKTFMCSKYVPYELSNDEPKLWNKFLGEIFASNNELIHYIQKIMGYALSGSTREQCMFILLGDGANGKSILTEVLYEVSGSYSKTSNVDVLLERKNQNGNLGEIARLNGVRNVVMGETKPGDKLNEGLIKTMTSGIEQIVARFLYGNEFEFTPIFKMFMMTNYRPIIRGTDTGIWRRIKIIPFDVTIPDDKQDKDLMNKMQKEYPQILNWLVQGCIMWQKEGISNPQLIDESIKQYRSEMDLVQRWIDECCELGAGYRSKSTDLFNAFCNYIAINREFQLSNTLFGRNMSKKFEKRRFGGAIYYIGLQLKDNQPMASKRWEDV